MILKKKKKSKELSDFKTYFKATIFKILWYWEKDKKKVNGAE